MGLFAQCQCCGKQISFINTHCTECFFETHDVVPKLNIGLQPEFNIDQQLEDLYSHIGERCPYLLAKHFGIKFTNRDLESDELCGMYKSTPIGYRIYLNARTDIDTQETTMYLLVKQHLEHKDEDRVITKQNLRKFKRAEKAARKYLKVIAEALLFQTKSQRA